MPGLIYVVWTNSGALILLVWNIFLVGLVWFGSFIWIILSHFITRKPRYNKSIKLEKKNYKETDCYLIVICPVFHYDIEIYEVLSWIIYYQDMTDKNLFCLQFSIQTICSNNLYQGRQPLILSFKTPGLRVYIWRKRFLIPPFVKNISRDRLSVHKGPKEQAEAELC